MNMQNTNTSEQSFKNFLFRDRHNRIILFFAAAAIMIQFGIFKYFYPYANYIHDDSFVYINAAYFNWDINSHPIGYSKFMRLFSVFNRTDLIFTAVQYLFIQCSALYLLFTIFYFYKPGRVIQYVLLGFMVLNPLFLYLGNMVGNDGLFLALSCTWFSLLLWIVHRPSLSVMIWHAIVLFIAFTVRYNALIYPFIALLAFSLSRSSLRLKLSGLAIAAILCGSFVGFNMYKYKKLTGFSQFAPFSGWQLANNVLYGYREVHNADHKPVPPKFQALDSMVRGFYKRTRGMAFFLGDEGKANTFYMWTRGFPLVDYQDSIFKNVKKTEENSLKLWASMAPLYNEYGWLLIKRYPMHFIRNFMLPNSRKYYSPPVEYLGIYNGGTDFVSKTTQYWFGYKSTKVRSRVNNEKILILEYYPILSGIINVLMLFGLLYYFFLKGWRCNLIFNKAVIICGVFWLLNAAFTIFSASIALRFQSFPIMLATTFSLLLVDWMIQLLKAMKEAEKNRIKEIEGISKEVLVG